MAKIEGIVDVNDFVKKCTMDINITGCGRLRVKVWVGTALIRCGLRIIGVQGKVNINE